MDGFFCLLSPPLLHSSPLLPCWLAEGTFHLVCYHAAERREHTWRFLHHFLCCRFNAAAAKDQHAHIFVEQIRCGCACVCVGLEVKVDACLFWFTSLAGGKIAALSGFRGNFRWQSTVCTDELTVEKQLERDTFLPTYIECIYQICSSFHSILLQRGKTASFSFNFHLTFYLLPFFYLYRPNLIFLRLISPDSTTTLHINCCRFSFDPFYKLLPPPRKISYLN